jgi:hypothetical protein
MSARSFTLDKKRQGNITVNRTMVEGVGEQIQVVLHDTAIVTKMPAGEVVLRSGGWLTNTTKTAINRGLSLLGLTVSIKQAKGQWFLIDGQDRLEFFDNMTVR